MLFEPIPIDGLDLPNRLIRSATAERMADDDGMPRPELQRLYAELTNGGVGLIVTGHLYVHPGGKCHPEMTGAHSDDLVPSLASLAESVHELGGRLVGQINHGGMQCSPDVVPQAVAPSFIDAQFLARPARELATDEITDLIQAYTQAARRLREAGFDGVQLHGAHGFLINQFLSPSTNCRADEWGGDLEGRLRFLREVCRSIQREVGPDFPMMIKLGFVDGINGGLCLEESLKVVSHLQAMGVDAVEVSGGIGGGKSSSVRAGIRRADEEAYFRPWARAAKAVTGLPVILVGGLRSRSVMEDVLQSGDADMISLSRPLICEPDLPNRMRLGLQDKSSCISANRCWAEAAGQGIACKCPVPDGVSDG
jgi:2,4-dienoyl-CoA reductase-like NADH-dependent reductase (Old Yellow Enzyme family)